MKLIHSKALALIVLLFCAAAAFAADDLKGEITYNPSMGGQYTAFPNRNSILNTRHNLMQNTLDPMMVDGNGDFIPGAGGRLTPEGGAKMNDLRNDYGQVCVYCHTPHAANAASSAPLWNRATLATTYTTYNQLGTNVEQNYSQPGGASLPCLSCHDGLQAVDAIINMPGAGRYNATPSNTSGTSGDLYVRWTGTLGVQRSRGHLTLASGSTGCLSCHADNGSNPTAVDFTVFAIGTDLRNDHPVGVAYPTTNGPGTDWNTPTGTKLVNGRTNRFFDETPNGRLDKTEIRLYDTGQGAEVECGSCHDPHGVPSAGPGSTFLPTFLRKPIAGSNLCLTCHAK